MNANNFSIVKRFIITGLFGNKDIDIDMSRPCCILIGENGLGKTTILSIINMVLSCQIQKLSEYNFKRIEIFIEDFRFAFTDDEVESFAKAYKYYSEDTDLSKLPELLKELKDNNLHDISKELISEAILRRPDLRRSYEVAMFDTAGHLADFIQSFANIFLFIQTCIRLNYMVVYLPTYRRIEADLYKIIKDFQNSRFTNERIYRYRSYTLNDSSDIIEYLSENKSSIQFGMKDIDELLTNMTNRVSQQSVRGFSKVAGGMLSKLIESNFAVKNTEFNKTEVEIVLQRSGGNISHAEKDRILEIIDNREIYNNQYLVYFLNQLVNVYKSQRVFDSALKGFVRACNEFLVDKKYYYNESNLKIGLYYRQDDNHTKPIGLNNLSSGEKQLISMMAKVYLELKSNLIILIDEPELSLSIRWQKLLLPILLKAEKCRQIIAVTHSPFIFSNELEENAIGSLEYVRYDK